MELFLNLFINGLATGMLLFLVAVGLSLIFGLMDVFNFGHGGLFVWGAFTGVWVYVKTGSFFYALCAAVILGLVLGWIIERVIIKPVYGNHISQILITLGVLIVLSELIKGVFGPNPIVAPVPSFLEGSWMIGQVILIKYRVFVICAGLVIMLAMNFVMEKTRVGLIVKAGVMNKEMVEALGINIKKVFMIVFMIGSSLATLGGILFAPYAGTIHANIGFDYIVFAFIVVVIGGMGKMLGSAYAAILVGVLGAFTAYYVPELSMASNMLIMVAVLLFKPSGLFGAKG